MTYTCRSCTAETDNDSDVCDACEAEAREEMGLCPMCASEIVEGVCPSCKEAVR